MLITEIQQVCMDIQQRQVKTVMHLTEEAEQPVSINYLSISMTVQTSVKDWMERHLNFRSILKMAGKM